MAPILVIDLTVYEIQCAVCDLTHVYPSSGPSYAVARYEDETVPDTHADWGGAAVCPTCYWVERGLRSVTPARMIPFSEIKAISRPEEY